MLRQNRDAAKSAVTLSAETTITASAATRQSPSAGRLANGCAKDCRSSLSRRPAKCAAGRSVATTRRGSASVPTAPNAEVPVRAGTAGSRWARRTTARSAVGACAAITLWVYVTAGEARRAHRNATGGADGAEGSPPSRRAGRRHLTSKLVPSSGASRYLKTYGGQTIQPFVTANAMEARATSGSGAPSISRSET
jgi:hypothetical protein